jgi:hypothetical protein
MTSCAPPSLPQLLYRYLFFAWLFRDASRGNLFERAAAWRHNQGCARWLPVYMRRWLILGLLLFALGWWAEALMNLPQFSALFYLPSILTVHVNVVAGVSWLGLKRLPPPV